MEHLPSVRAPVRQLATLAVALLAASLPATPTLAQAYPTRPVTVVVPLAPGGPVDAEARLYSQKLTELTGQTFVLDYKTGAGGLLGIQHVARAAPDGYTLLIGSTGLTVLPATKRNPGYDLARDFAPVSLMTKKPSMLVMNPAVPVKDFAELVAYSKARPGELNFGTTGSGGATDLAGRFLASASGMSLTFVHYKGTGPLTVDLLAGRVHLATTNLISGLSLLKSGKLRVLGVTSLKRQTRMPDVPALAENGAPGYEYVGWTGFLAPAKTPPAIVNQLSAEMGKVMRADEVMKKLADSDAEFIGSSPDDMRRHVLGEFARWQKVVQDAGIKVED